MSLQRNNYEVLGVSPRASTDEIKRKYRELARKFHPDIAKDKVMGQKIFSQINQAYHILGDPDRRAQYDATLAADSLQRTPASAPNASANGANGAKPANRPVTAQDAENASRLVSEAERALLENNIGKVKQICEAVIAIDPRNQKAHALLGDALAGMGKKQEAIAAYRNAVQIAPSFAVQAKLDRLQGARPAPVPNGTGTRPAAPPPSAPHRNGATATAQRPTTKEPQEKSVSGLFSRLLGKK